MKRYKVILESTTSETTGYYYFYFCDAKDREHAEIKALAAYPNDLIVEVESNDVFKH